MRSPHSPARPRPLPRHHGVFQHQLFKGILSTNRPDRCLTARLALQMKDRHIYSFPPSEGQVQVPAAARPAGLPRAWCATPWSLGFQPGVGTCFANDTRSRESVPKPSQLLRLRQKRQSVLGCLPLFPTRDDLAQPREGRLERWQGVSVSGRECWLRGHEGDFSKPHCPCV